MKKASLAFDKRKYPRLKIEIPIRYKVINHSQEVIALLEHKKVIQTGNSKDISAEGLFLVSGHRLFTGDILKVEMQLPETEAPIRAFSEVIWSSEMGLPSGRYGSGLYFMALRDEDQQRMQSYVNKVLAEESSVGS